MRKLAGWLWRRWFVRTPRNDIVGREAVVFRFEGPMHLTIAVWIEDGNGRPVTVWSDPVLPDFPLGIDLLSGYFFDVCMTDAEHR